MSFGVQNLTFLGLSFKYRDKQNAFVLVLKNISDTLKFR